MAHFLKIAVLSSSILLAACGSDQIQRSISEDRSENSTRLADSKSHGSQDGTIHSLNGWREKVDFFVATNAPDQVLEAAIAAANSWNQAVGRTLIEYKGRVEPNGQAEGSLYSSLEDLTTIIYFDPSWTLHTKKPTTTLATTVWENDPNDPDFMVRGDVVLNAESYLYQDAKGNVTVPNREDDVVDSESVLLHEMGHLLGLDHVETDMDKTSIMVKKTYVGLGIHNRLLSEGDKQRIGKIYKK